MRHGDATDPVRDALLRLADAPGGLLTGLDEVAGGLGAHWVLGRLREAAAGGGDGMAALEAAAAQASSRFAAGDPRRRGALTAVLHARAVARQHAVVPFDAATLDSLMAASAA